MRMLDRDDEAGDATEVTWEDQQRINTFSKLNSRARSVEEKLEELKQEKEALDDLATELELADEQEPILYRVGETFIHLSHNAATKRLEKDQKSLEKQVLELSTVVEDCEREMKQLKVVLYAKFGRAINLDE